ncbi:MAG TPA: 16S rRNA (cytosine(967)-C(5))-methyltransferase RsmB [Burkholderiales bacterium]|nr:16S rRNA (cytosine(967)-C(5))-methyltransferase RsmB [Burkholderiales bacterium]
MNAQPVPPRAGVADVLQGASRIIARVAAGKSLSAEIARAAEEGFAAPRAALIDVTHGTLRRYGRSQAIVRALSRQGRSEALVEALLWSALYLLESGRHAPYTVVDQAVRACALLEKWPAKGFVNALLRRFLRERKLLEARLLQDPEARHQHPAWWIEALRDAYPADWAQLLEAGNLHPPMCLRVNRRRATPQAMLETLAAEGLAAERIGPVGILLARPVPVERLPGFMEGALSVQDAGAQRAVEYLDLKPELRVLDACAAPGGKSAHILETADVDLAALDIDALRCARIEQNFRRLGLTGRVTNADCQAPATWWDGRYFDRVLADVPCSGSGVVRRHPDIKWIRREEDITALAQRQGQILDALWRVLAPGGKLLYVTCSVFPQENDAVIELFLRRQPDAERLPLPAGSPAQCLPDARQDGFFFALVEKRT